MTISWSRNIVTARIDAGDNVIVGDGNTIISLKEAAQYKVLEAELKKLDTRFKKTRAKIEKYPDDQDFRTELLQISQEQNTAKHRIESLKNEVIRLAEDFAKIPINTERLRLAKQYFEDGHFEKARGILDAETMTRELDALLIEKENLKQKNNENERQLADKANEFLILARLTVVDYKQLNRFKEAQKYLEQSLVADRNIYNLFEYANLLYKCNNFNLALPVYEELINAYRALARQNPQLYLFPLATTLHNIGLTYRDLKEYQASENALRETIEIISNFSLLDRDNYLNFKADALNSLGTVFVSKNDFESAKIVFNEALEIHKTFSNSDKENHFYQMAILLNNMANLYNEYNEFDTAEKYYQETISLKRKLVLNDPNIYLQSLALTLHNFGESYRRRGMYELSEKYLEEALAIRRKIAEKNPHIIMPNLATTLNNLGLLHLAKNDFKLAKQELNECLQVFRELEKLNPKTYTSSVLQILVNLGKYFQDTNEFRSAKVLLLEALKVSKEISNNDTLSLLPTIIQLYNNLGGVCALLKELSEAELAFTKGLDLSRESAKVNPKIFVSLIASNLVNLSIFYQREKPNFEKSIEFAKEALKYSLPLMNLRPDMQVVVARSIDIIQSWGIDINEILMGLKLKID
jgi:tetratricopeptide (TPR) repeat protein